jgi:hypothetical protein
MFWKTFAKVALFVVVTAAQIYCDRKASPRKRH